MSESTEARGHCPSEALRKTWREEGGVFFLAVMVAELLAERPAGWTNMELAATIEPIWKARKMRRCRPLQMLASVREKLKKLLRLERGELFVRQDPENARIFWYGIVRTSDDSVTVFSSHWSQAVARIYTLEQAALHLLATQAMTEEHRKCCMMACRAATFFREQLIVEVEKRCDELVEGVLRGGRRRVLTADEESTLDGVGKLPRLPESMKTLLLGTEPSKKKG